MEPEGELVEVGPKVRSFDLVVGPDQPRLQVATVPLGTSRTYLSRVPTDASGRTIVPLGVLGSAVMPVPCAAGQGGRDERTIH
jgi:hypothetical protein